MPYDPKEAAIKAAFAKLDANWTPTPPFKRLREPNNGLCDECGRDACDIEGGLCWECRADDCAPSEAELRKWERTW